MSSHDELPGELVELIDMALELDDQDSRSAAIDGALAAIEVFDPDDRNAEAQYARGYLLYVHPERSQREDHVLRSEEALHKALEANPSPEVEARSWLYLAHGAYDRGDYSEAVEALFRVRQAATGTYLWLKALELHVCSVIRSAGVGEALELLDAFVEALEGSELEDVMPQELGRTLSGWQGELSRGQWGKLQKLARRIDAKADAGDWFVPLVRDAEESAT